MATAPDARSLALPPLRRRDGAGQALGYERSLPSKWSGQYNREGAQEGVGTQRRVPQRGLPRGMKAGVDS